MRLFSASIILSVLLCGCVSKYRYFPESPEWMSRPEVYSQTNDVYTVNHALIHNYVYQILYLEAIDEWRKNNGVP